MPAKPKLTVIHQHSTETEIIDPIKASDYLETMDLNRPVIESRVKLYARQMSAGEWLPSPQPIIFNTEGQLIDGQHRLWAVIESGASIEVAVARNYDTSIREVLDTGKSRTATDLLALAGYPNPKLHAAAITRIHAYETTGTFNNPHGALLLTPHEVLLRAQTDPAIIDAATQGNHTYFKFRPRGWTPAIVATLYYLFARINTDDCEAFFERLTSGLFTQANDPIYQLRERLLANESKQIHYSRNQIGALAIKAWNLYRTGDTVNRLVWNGGGANPEPFPEPR
jgi:hypothetical protein